ncbi:MAG: DUF4249 domain-containing protein [Prevotella sp.]|nr:DUF4249 domain-containing protein [Prevotella sp.]
MKYTICLLVSLLLTSCYKEISVGTDDQGEMVVINCISRSDSAITADISHSWLFSKKTVPGDLEGLDVRLWINGQARGKMNYSKGLYRSTVRPKTGDTVMISTYVDGKEVWARDVMPPKSVIKRVDMSRINAEDDQITYKITMTNDTSQIRYFFLLIRYNSNEGAGINYSFDPVFQLTNEEINGGLAQNKIMSFMGYPFTNRGMSGSEYTLTVKETALEFWLKIADYNRDVTVFSISEAYYKYILNNLANRSGTTLYGDFMELGLAEPRLTFTNVHGGLGLLACYQQHTVRIKVPKLK